MVFLGVKWSPSVLNLLHYMWMITCLRRATSPSLTKGVTIPQHNWCKPPLLPQSFLLEWLCGVNYKLGQWQISIWEETGILGERWRARWTQQVPPDHQEVLLCCLGATALSQAIQWSCGGSSSEFFKSHLNMVLGRQLCTEACASITQEDAGQLWLVLSYLQWGDLFAWTAGKVFSS